MQSRNIFTALLAAVLLLFPGGPHVSAQTIDKDILALRNTSIPHFRYSYDDYLQYAPAMALVGMKVCGYESRSSWGRMIVSDAFSTTIMAATVNSIKYTVRRMRPDGSASNSFPSGHTATAFMTATMLHKEYGWRSPWFSIGAYTVAAVTGVSRLLNNRHWMSDVLAGGAIGIGAVHLGYFITDKIFSDKGLYGRYSEPEFLYDSSVGHYSAELFFGRRFIIGNETGQGSLRGGQAGVQVEIPVTAQVGIFTKAAANSLSYKDNIVRDMYSISAGGFWKKCFARILEFQAYAAAGYAYMQGDDGVDFITGASLSLITDSNFKVKAFAEYDATGFAHDKWTHSALVGWGAAWMW